MAGAVYSTILLIGMGIDSFFPRDIQRHYLFEPYEFATVWME
jgi:hypothetical protein